MALLAIELIALPGTASADNLKEVGMLCHPGLEIKAVLDRGASAWSTGDLDAFVACYENSPDTVYLTRTKVVTGYGAIRSIYAERLVAANAAERGALTMTLLRVTPLGPEHALAVGRYLLDREEALGGEATGFFSLVFHNTAAAWRIAADHTS